MKGKQPALIPASLHGLAVASLREARWPDLTGGCAPETGHLADSMPEAGGEEYSLLCILLGVLLGILLCILLCILLYSALCSASALHVALHSAMLFALLCILLCTLPCFLFCLLLENSSKIVPKID